MQAKSSRAFVAMQAPRRCREPRSKATCPLSDPDTVANISFGIGIGRRAAQSRVLGWSSWSCAPTLQGIKCDKLSLLPLCKAHERFSSPSTF